MGGTAVAHFAGWGVRVTDAIGHTPLVRLGPSVRELRTGVSIVAKAEFLNPTGSVKDRAAWGIVQHALRAGRLLDGRTLIDASSGNTGVSFAMLGAALGFPVELCLPRTVSVDRVERMRAYGARTVFTDPGEGTDGAQQEARRRAESEPDRYFYADQYNNPANPEAHYRTTGPEIWKQTGGQVTHLVAGVGTGGTISGTARYLRERSPNIQVVGVEPEEPLHGIEGLKHLPTSTLPTTYDPSLVDATIRVRTEEAQEMASRLTRLEGFQVGNSAGAAVVASLRIARTLNSGTVVTILPDRGGREPGGERS